MRGLRKLTAAVVALSMICAVIPAAVAKVGENKFTRKMENLDRGLVAMMTKDGVYLTWRLLGTEAYDTTFDVYRGFTKIATGISNSTNYLDASGTQTSVYKVVSSNETYAGVTKTATPFASGTNYLEIPVAPIEDYEATYNGTDYVYEYKIHDASVGDVDGDGEYEIIVKREANHQHAGAAGFNHMFLEAYKLDGTVLWRIDMGQNMRAMTEFVFLVYDFNNDGAAEIACKTAPGSKDAVGNYVTSVSLNSTIKNADNTADYHDSNGFLLTGPEYFTLFDGRNGQALDTIEYPILRSSGPTSKLANSSANNSLNYYWGDNYGHRAEKCMGAVSYFDGVNPGIALWRGIYSSGYTAYGPGRTAAANISVNSSTNRMTVESRFDTWSGGDGYVSGNEKYIGQGNHSVAVGDVDNDGKDEFISGGLCLDDDMTALWSTYRGHGDAHHLAEYDPTNNSLEYLTVQEEGSTDGSKTVVNDFGETITLNYGMTLAHASDGKELYHIGNTGDTGRGVMANVGAGGYFQFWGKGVQQGNGKTVDYDGDASTDSSAVGAADTYSFEDSSYSPASYNFRIFWDGDVYDELFDSYNVSSRDFRPSIFNYNTSTGKDERIFYNDDTVTINDTKSHPLLQADIFGDWREELVLKTKDDMAMRIYTTDISTTNKLYTLMHDTLYRQGVALQNQYYNQPPHIDYYVCEKDDDLYNASYDQRSNKPNIEVTTHSGTAPSATAMPVKQLNTTRDTDYVIDEDGDYYSAVNDSSPVGTYWTTSTDGIGRQTLLATTNDATYLALAEANKHIKSYDGKFLLFSAAGANTKFETKSTTKSVASTGKLEFAFMLPTTYSDNGTYAYGNAPTTMYVGDGTDNALEFTVTPNVYKSYVNAATLSVNGTDICSFSTGEEAQSWTEVDCAIDHTNKKAYITVTKADGDIYTATVDYVKDCGNLTTFGVDASKYYGTIALDDVKLYSTSSLEQSSKTKTADYEAVNPQTNPTKNNEHFYELNLSGIVSGQITQKLNSSESKSDASLYNIGNFRTATLKTAAIPELDGWGYIHAAYDNLSGRQTAASVDVSSNAVVINGTSNVGGAVVIFIPKNIEGITMPTTGTITYTFTAVVSKAAGSAAGSVNYGFTKSSDGSAVSSAASVSIAQTSADEDVTAAVVMTYNLDTNAYSITVDGEEKASGTASGITGIYAQSNRSSYTNGSIVNLVVDASDWKPEASPTPAPPATPTPVPVHYYYNNDFSDYSAAIAVSGSSAKEECFDSLTSGSITKDDVLAFYNNYSSGNRSATVNLDSSGISTNKGVLTFSAILATNLNSVGADSSSIFQLLGSDGSKIFSFTVNSAGTTLTPTIGTTAGTDVTLTIPSSAGKIVYNGTNYTHFPSKDVATLAGNSAVRAATSDWMELDVDVDFSKTTNNVTVTLTDLETGNAIMDGVTGTTSATNIKSIYVDTYRYYGAVVFDKISVSIPESALATPTPKPTATPTAKPTATPTAKPTATPTAKPTATPTVKPTATPGSVEPVNPPSSASATPTATPGSAEPVNPPSSASATPKVTAAPTTAATTAPTTAATTAPTAAATQVPAVRPTAKATTAPTIQPTTAPSTAATLEPSETVVPETTVSPSPEPIIPPTPTAKPEKETINPIGNYKDKIEIAKVSDETGITLVITPKSDITLGQITVYAAVYNENTTLKSVIPVICEVSADGTVSVPLSEPLLTQSGEYYKLIIWDRNQSPLIDVITKQTGFFG